MGTILLAAYAVAGVVLLIVERWRELAVATEPPDEREPLWTDPLADELEAEVARILAEPPPLRHPDA